MDIIVIFLGFLTHHLMLLSKLRLTNDSSAHRLILFYVTERPFKLIISIIGMIMGFVLISVEFASLFDMAQTNAEFADVTKKYYITLFSTGYISDSVVDMLGSSAKKKMTL